MRPYPYLSSFSSREADAALSIRAERLISRMFSPIATNQIGKSDTRDRAAGWSQRRRLFGSKTQRAIRFEVASTKPWLRNQQAGTARVECLGGSFKRGQRYD
jgi:hypothetical protein